VLKRIARPVRNSPNRNLFGVWQQRVRSRHQLRDLSRIDDHLLKDIGLNRHELLCEGSKPFWRSQVHSAGLQEKCRHALPSSCVSSARSALTNTKIATSTIDLRSRVLWERALKIYSRFESPSSSAPASSRRLTRAPALVARMERSKIRDQPGSKMKGEPRITGRKSGPPSGLRACCDPAALSNGADFSRELRSPADALTSLCGELSRRFRNISRRFRNMQKAVGGMR
jgi:uncharacterized protein YjiS (DUF1127 family)